MKINFKIKILFLFVIYITIAASLSIINKTSTSLSNNLTYSLQKTYEETKEFSTFSLFTNLVTDFIQIYFSKRKCFTFLKELKINSLLKIERLINISISIVQLNEENKNSYYEVLLNNFENGCDWFVVQTRNINTFIDTVIMVLEKSNHRSNPRILILPFDYNFEVNEFSRNIFNKTKNILPDVLVINLNHSNSGTLVDFETADWITAESINLYSCFINICNINNSGVHFFPDKLKQLRGKTLRYTTFQYPPYSLIEPMVDGTEYKIIEEFSKRYNFSLSLYTDDNMWGEIFDNHTGNGVLGSVYERKVDIGFAGLFEWYNEYQLLDYSIPYLRSGVTCLVPKVQAISPWILPLLPFDRMLWFMVLLTLILATITLYRVAKVANQFSSNWRLRFRTASDSMIRVIGLLVLQVPTARGIKPPPISLRYLITWLEVMFTLIVTSYHSGLASNLTVLRYEKPIETVQDLVDSKLPWAATHNAWIFSIRLSQEPNTKTLLQRFQTSSSDFLGSHVKTRDLAFAAERLLGGSYAVGDYISVDSFHYLQLMKEDIYFEHISMIVPKGSPYLEKLNNVISDMQTSGLLLYWEREMVRLYLSQDIQHAIAQSTIIELEFETKSLQVKHILGCLAILFLGHSLALITFVMEVLSVKIKNSKAF